MSYTDILLGKKLSGGGGNNWELLWSGEYDVPNTTSTSATDVDVVSFDPPIELEANDILWWQIKDKAGKRAGYFYESNGIYLNTRKANQPETIGNLSSVATSISVDANGDYTYSTTAAGVYPSSIETDYKCQWAITKITIKKRYNSSASRTVDGTYIAKLYKLKCPVPNFIFE